jgi:hypothetical protein
MSWACVTGPNISFAPPVVLCAGIKLARAQRQKHRATSQVLGKATAHNGGEFGVCVLWNDLCITKKLSSSLAHQWILIYRLF